MRSIRARITYANVVATIALFGVLAGGGAYAAQKIGPKDIGKNAVRAKHIKKNQVKTKHVANGAVKPGKLAPAVIVPRAYAYVQNSQIVPAQSRGVGQATATQEGSFVCFNGLPFTPRNVQVTVVRLGGSLQPFSANTGTQGTGDITFCPGAEDAFVQFFDTSGAVVGSPPRFFVTFYD